MGGIQQVVSDGAIWAHIGGQTITDTPALWWMVSSPTMCACPSIPDMIRFKDAHPSLIILNLHAPPRKVLILTKVRLLLLLFLLPLLPLLVLLLRPCPPSPPSHVAISGCSGPRLDLNTISPTPDAVGHTWTWTQYCQFRMLRYAFEHMPKRMPDTMPVRMSERMSERMSDRMPDRMQNIWQIEWQNRCQIECQAECQNTCQIECENLCRTEC